MSVSETPRQARDKSSGLAAELRHIGVSLLPLALFVAGALAYDQLAAARRSQGSPAAAASAPVIAAIVPPAAGPAPEVTETVGGKPQTAHVAPVAAPTLELRDGRSLLDLPEHGKVTADTAAPPALPAPVERELEMTLGASAPLPLGLDAAVGSAPGAYAILRGVPKSARLSHGIAVGSDSWLIDGADIAATSLDMRAGEPGEVGLELTVLTRESRVVATERIRLAIRPAPAQPSPTPMLTLSPTPTPTVTSAARPEQPHAPEVASAPVPATSTVAPPTAPAATTTTPSLPPRPVKLAIARDTILVPGRGSLLRVDIDAAPAMAEGAHVVLRGLPQETALSSGTAIGAGVWLLTLAELAALEVRLPAKVRNDIDLDARLVAADGRLLAGDIVRINQEIVPVAPSRTAAIAATPPIVTRALPQTTAAATPPATKPAPPVTTAAAPAAPAATSHNVALTRGRRMLEIGNIAVARPLLERAALEGSGEAAALLGASFDDGWLRRQGALGIVGDADKAKRWYDEARRLGTPDVDRVVVLQKPKR